MTTSVTEARELARSLLASALPRRWAHVQGVARQAAHTADRLGYRDGVLVAAAWLHDIRYAQPSPTQDSIRSTAPRER